MIKYHSNFNLKEVQLKFYDIVFKLSTCFMYSNEMVEHCNLPQNVSHANVD